MQSLVYKVASNVEFVLTYAYTLIDMGYILMQNYQCMEAR